MVRRSDETREQRKRTSKVRGERTKSPNDWRYILRRDRSLPQQGGVNFSVLYTRLPILDAALYLSSIVFHPSLAAGKSLRESDLIDRVRVLRRREKLTIGCTIVGERYLGMEECVIYVIIFTNRTYIHKRVTIILNLLLYNFKFVLRLNLSWN